MPLKIRPVKVKPPGSLRQPVELPVAGLVPHQGRMCLLDVVTAWSEASITCRVRSHLDPDNPLLRDGRLGALCGVEYGLQAAAAHGALTNGASPAHPGYLAAIRAVELFVPWLDEPDFGLLAVTARLLLRESKGWIYGFELVAQDGATLVAGRGTIVMPPS
jgi:predicted hotdog family 3-hydroxylacyl-ACP dehydratase